MTPLEVRNSLYRAIQEHLPGWKLVKPLEGFVRPIPGGTQRISVPVADYRPEFRFSLVMLTRLDAAEEIFNRFSGARPPADATTSTSMTQLAYFFPGAQHPKQFAIHDEAEVTAAVSALAPVIRNSILPFLDSHRDIASLDAALNGSDSNLDRSDVTQRMMHSLIVAHLAGNPQFDDIAARAEAAISTFPAMLKQRVAGLIEYLRSQRAS